MGRSTCGAGGGLNIGLGFQKSLEVSFVMDGSSGEVREREGVDIEGS